jgi:hypothetical protein
MFNSKFIATLIALAVALVAICNYSSNTVTSNESFIPSRTWKKDRVIASSREAAQRGEFVSVPGTYQAILNPRFSNVAYSSAIRYKMPERKHQAVPEQPLTFGKMAVENYRENYGSCVQPGCGKCDSDSFIEEPEMQVHDVKKLDNSEYLDATDMIPVETMTSVNAMGETQQHVVYDRLMFANRNSRLRSRGDMIRGDLAIAPCNTGWFNVSVQPNLDLQQGALFAMGGYDNESAQKMAELVNASSGQYTIAGVNLASSKNTLTGQGMADVQVVGFP